MTLCWSFTCTTFVVFWSHWGKSMIDRSKYYSCRFGHHKISEFFCAIWKWHSRLTISRFFFSVFVFLSVLQIPHTNWIFLPNLSLVFGWYSSVTTRSGKHLKVLTDTFRHKLERIGDNKTAVDSGGSSRAPAKIDMEYITSCVNRHNDAIQWDISNKLSCRTNECHSLVFFRQIR